MNGWVTNLLARPGNYATVGQSAISIVDADSFWVDAYFEETNLADVHEGDELGAAQEPLSLNAGPAASH